MKIFPRIPLLVLALALVAATLSPARAWDKSNTDQTQFMLRGSADRIARIAERYGLHVLYQLAPDGNSEAVALVKGSPSLSPDQVLELVETDDEVVGFEPAAVASLPVAGLEQSTASLLEQSTASLLEQSTASILESTGTYADGRIEQLFGGPLWNGYANQPAVRLLNIHQAHAASSSYGSGIVAVIDTGVDPHHPLLRGALVPGYDFVDEAAGFASEWSALDQSTASLLEQSTASLLEQSTASLLEGHDLPPTFGHGTMVAGVIRLVAPGAQIMPLRAFDASGSAHMYDIVRAIHFAVDHGAQVINMSFSTEAYSAELARAINYAHRNGVLCVSAAGNRSERVMTYPAALGFSIGVTSTGWDDSLSPFSNYGSDLVTLAAPGEAIVTTYPGGSFAAVSGTSFSTPFVAGTLALLYDFTGGGYHPSDYYKAAYSLARGAVFLPELSSEVALGRLDVEATITGGSGGK